MTATVAPPTPRLGGHLVADSLAALGADVAFGVPGIHALAIWEGLRTSGIEAIGTATELGAGFAADGCARITARPAPLLLSTGPGALNSLTALMEASSSHVPVVAISSQIPSDLVGRRRGYLHELADQMASARPLVKLAVRAQSVESIPELLAHAWSTALEAPSGPVFVEIPVDLLTAPAPGRVLEGLAAEPVRRAASVPAIAAAARLLANAERPVIWAGGGVIRSGAQSELRALAERIDAPVATTYMGKGALGDEHSLAAGCGCDDAALQELLMSADVLLCVGTELGAETTAQYELRLSGRLIHLDADPARIGATYPALPLVGDARETLLALATEVPQRSDPEAARRVAAVRSRIRDGLRAQKRQFELGVLDSVRDALDDSGILACDMTILGYWAAPHMPLESGQGFLYPLGSGTLGYAWPAALGAKAANPARRVLAVVGDGGLQYALGELGTAARRRLDAKLLVVDDEAYGILREYQLGAFGHTTAVELGGTDLVACARSFGVPARAATPESLDEQLRWAFRLQGPAVVVLRARLNSARPTA